MQHLFSLGSSHLLGVLFIWLELLLHVPEVAAEPAHLEAFNGVPPLGVMKSSSVGARFFLAILLLAGLTARLSYRLLVPTEW